jgi:hypothetical protein
MSNVLSFKRRWQMSAVYLDTIKFQDHFRYQVFLGNDGEKVGSGLWSGHDYADATDMAAGLARDYGLPIVHRVQP